MNRLKTQATRLCSQLRRARREYETYLYQATGRKVDFEVAELERGTGVQYNVQMKFIVQKDSTEPMAPRFYIDVRVVPGELDEVEITLNAGFISAIGMKHSKFTQEGFKQDDLSSPPQVFSWIEFLKGDFLKAKRVVRPFDGGSAEMGILTAKVASTPPEDLEEYEMKVAAAKDIDLREDALGMSYVISDTMPDSDDVRWALFTFGSHSLATYLDHAAYYDAASLVRQALLLLMRDTEQVAISWLKAMIEARNLADPCEKFQESMLSGDHTDVPFHAADCIDQLARVSQALGYEAVATGLWNCEMLIR
jgi:hypothetical protein